MLLAGTLSAIDRRSSGLGGLRRAGFEHGSRKVLYRFDVLERRWKMIDRVAIGVDQERFRDTGHLQVVGVVATGVTSVWVVDAMFLDEKTSSTATPRTVRPVVVPIVVPRMFISPERFKVPRS